MMEDYRMGAINIKKRLRKEASTITFVEKKIDTQVNNIVKVCEKRYAYHNNRNRHIKII